MSADQPGRPAAPGPLRVSPAVVIPAHELTWRFSRSSGPGGQGVNTTDSRVELVFDLAASSAFPPELKERALERLSGRLVGGVLTIAASEFRSQLRNRDAARARLGDLLAAAVAAPPRARKATKPSRASTARRLDAKSRRSSIKQMRRRPPD